MASFFPAFEKILKTGKVHSDTLMQILNLDEAQQQTVVEKLALAKDDVAYDILSYLMNTMGPTHPIRPRLYQLIMDRAHMNFKFALILINHTNPAKPGPITPLTRHILNKSTDKDLIKDIFRAAGRLGMEFLVEDLAEFIFYDDLELRKEAVTAMERIGTDKALQKLEQIAQTDKCDADVLDALAFLKAKRKTTPLSKSQTKTQPTQPATPPPPPCPAPRTDAALPDS